MLNAALELSNLNGSNGFAINGVATNDFSGYSVGGFGDVNGDGISDVIIGALNAAPGGRANAGASYVVFGKDTEFNSPLELSALDGTNGFAINGVNALDFSGNSVSNAGDVNGDGISDVIIGAYGASPGGLNIAGICYVVFGKDTGFSSPLELSTLDGTNGFAIHGVTAGDTTGDSISAAGDINRDGISDVIIGASNAAPGGRSEAGISYVVFGQDTGFSSPLELSMLNGSNGFAIHGVAAGDSSGISVSGVGDVNGDGISDVIIGASGAAPGGRISAGTSYVVFGRDTGFNSSLELSTLDGSNGFVINGVTAGDNSGFSVSSAEDVNGDGINDVIIGAYQASPGGRGFAGTSYVVFGKDTGFNSSLELSTLNGSNGFSINGVAAGDLSGNSASGVRDVNGDGISDVIIGAYQADPSGRSQAGISYVVFGKDTGFSSSLELSTLDGNNGFSIIGAVAGDQSGFSVISAGDINGDGEIDVIIGAPGVAGASGASYVIYGISAPVVTTSTTGEFSTSTTGGASSSSDETSPANSLEPSVVNFLFGSHAGFFARSAEVLGGTVTAVKPMLGM